MPPKSLKIQELDATIMAAVKRFSGGPLPGIKGPIINGIIINETALKGAKALDLAKELTSAVSLSEGIAFKPTVKKLGDGKLIIGFVNPLSLNQ